MKRTIIFALIALSSIPGFAQNQPPGFDDDITDAPVADPWIFLLCALALLAWKWQRRGRRAV